MDKTVSKTKWQWLLSFPVIVAALGYFVDIYDLLLFGIVRVPSLQALHLDADAVGTTIINCQMVGLIIGGILWGVLGDRKGRLSVLFGSILVYSLANIACGFLPYFPQEQLVFWYALLRFIAGVGLAGELGAGITLVAESLPVHLRALGTSLVAGFGLSGAVVAGLTVEWAGDWTIAYWIGGSLGLLLLLLRVSVLESQLFEHVQQQDGVSKGNFFAFFTEFNRFKTYLKCVTIGLPTWFCIGILAMMANQFAVPLNCGQLEPGKAIMWAYVGVSLGDFGSGFLSHALQSRRKAIALMLAFTLIGVSLMLLGAVHSATAYYAFCVWIGLGTGYWALFVTVAAEQFGTNLRNTATTTIPNMVRGLVPVMLWSFDYLKTFFSVPLAAYTLGVVIFGLGFWATKKMTETHNRSLHFIEN
ncbi:MAG: MFS transporter [Flavobacterium sp. BFFFF2]|nr:MAG: MFS transporter [Flavobacterium sp. BFFFF2]